MEYQGRLGDYVGDNLLYEPVCLPPAVGDIGVSMNIVKQPCTLLVRGRNAGMGTAARAAELAGFPSRTLRSTGNPCLAVRSLPVEAAVARSHW